MLGLLLAERLSEAGGPEEILLVVAEAIESTLGQKVGRSRLVLEELPPDVAVLISRESGTIVLNRELVVAAQSALASSEDLRAILFVLLTHGCLRSLGYEDENDIMAKAQLVARRALGSEHRAAKVAAGLFPMISPPEPMDEGRLEDYFHSGEEGTAYLG